MMNILFFKDIKNYFLKKINNDDEKYPMRKNMYNLPLELQFKIAEYIPNIQKNNIVKRIYKSKDNVLIHNFENSYWSKILKLENYNYDECIFETSNFTNNDIFDIIKNKMYNKTYLHLNFSIYTIIEDYDKKYFDYKNIKTKYLHIDILTQNFTPSMLDLFDKLELFSFYIICENNNLKFLDNIISRNLRLSVIFGIINFKKKKNIKTFLKRYEEKFNYIFIYYSKSFPIIIITSHKLKSFSRIIRFSAKEFFDNVIYIKKNKIYYRE